MKIITLKKPTNTHILIGVFFLVIGAAWAYTYVSLQQAKKDITTLWIAMENVPGGNQAFAIAHGQYVNDYVEDDISSLGATYRIANQYVENLDVEEGERNYETGEEPTYITKSVRVVEIEVTNNEQWVYSVYGNIGLIDEGGMIIRPTLIIKEDQNKNNTLNKGYGLELAPGGKGILYLYFEDEGIEIERLYDIDNSKEIRT